MRLWHYKLLPYLPNSQLLAQKRECDLIWKDIHRGKKTNHILINYIWDYGTSNFASYYYLLQEEFKRRNFKFNNKSNWGTVIYEPPYKWHHNNEYLTMNFWNLMEKYVRGQKDFTTGVWEKLDEFYKEEKMKSE